MIDQWLNTLNLKQVVILFFALMLVVDMVFAFLAFLIIPQWAVITSLACIIGLPLFLIVKSIGKGMWKGRRDS